MSENARKRCRKSKLVLRECLDYVEEDVDLEKKEQPPHKKKLLEKIKKEPEDVPVGAAPPVQFSVNVEVEDMDGSLPDDDPSNYMKYLFSLSKNSQEPEPIKPLEFVDNTSLLEMKPAPEEEKNSAVNMSKLQLMLVSLGKKYPKDRQAVIHTRNQWGRVFADRHTFRLQKLYADIQLNSVLQEWKSWSVCSRYRESPFCYKCYICTSAWWSFTEFREHLSVHNEFRLQLEIRHQECNITAYEQDRPSYEDIYVNGKCLKCARNYDDHISNKTQPDAFYFCKYCQDRFQTCSCLSKHIGTCPRNPIRVLSFAKDGKRITLSDFSCQICETVFLSNVDLIDHMEICHKVRSDEPVALKYKVCRLCEEVYYIYNFHICMKKNFNYECSHCHGVFQTKYMLDSHQLNWNSVVRCEICNKFLQKGCMAAEHYALHSENFQMVHRCLMCKKTKVFVGEESLKIHMSKYHRRADGRHIRSEKIIIPRSVLQECMIDVVAKNEVKTKNKVVKKKVRVYVPVHSKNNDIIPVHHVTVAHDDTVTMRTDKEPKNTKVTVKNTVTEVKKEPENTDVIKDKAIKIEPHYTVVRVKQEKDIDDNGDAAQQNVRQVSTDVDTTIRENVPQVSTNVDDKAQENVEEARTDVEKTIPENVPQVSTDLDKTVPANVPQVSTDLDKTVPENVPQFSTDLDKTVPENVPQVNTDVDFTIQENVPPEHNTDVPESPHFDINKVVIKREKIDDDKPIENEATEHDDENDKNKDIPRIMEELNEFLDIKPEIVKIKEEKHYDDESQDNLNDIVKVFQASSTFAEEVTDHSEISKVFKASRSLLKSEAVVKKQMKLELDDEESNVFNSSNDSLRTDGLESVNSDHSESLVNLEPEVILQAGYKKRKIYKCNKCEFSAYHREYKEHINSLCKKTSFGDELSNLSDSYKCTKCERNFPNLKKYALHFDKHGYGYMTCPQCLQTFDSITKLTPHLNTHIKNMFVRIQLLSDEDLRSKVYQCKTCKEIENSKNSFEHWERHLELKKIVPPKVTEEPYKSGSKNEPALKATVLKEVIATLLQEEKSTTGTRDIKFCFICNRRFERRNDGKRHLIEHLLEDAFANIATNEALKCQICSELHKKQDAYKKHMRDHASLPIYQCRLCDKSFSDSSNFTKHKKIHNLKAYVCDICNKKFQAKFSLEKHMEMHQNTDPITCDLCNKVFYCPSFYKRHVRQFHDKIACRFKCSFCREKFNTIREKWDHMWEVHKHRKEKADCPVCGKSYRKIADVKKHAQTEHQMTISLSNVWTILGDIMQEKEAKKGGKEVKQVVKEENDSDDDDCLIIEEERETLVVYD